MADWPFRLHASLDFPVLFLTANVHDTSDTSNTPITCCFVYTSRQIPRKLVNDYYLTSSLCLQPAVIFQTKKGRKICADPKTTWVKEYIADLELEA